MGPVVGTLDQVQMENNLRVPELRLAEEIAEPGLFYKEGTGNRIQDSFLFCAGREHGPPPDHNRYAHIYGIERTDSSLAGNDDKLYHI